MRTMALLLSIAGAAASCTEACGAVACGDGSCTATAFGHRMCADGGSCASTEDLFVEVKAAFGENLIDANNGDHADTVADDLNNKVIARFLEEV